MANYHETFLQGLRFFPDYCNPRAFAVTHRLTSVNDLRQIADQYDLLILDRDCTLHGYHENERDAEFEDTLQAIKDKAEIASNSSYGQFVKIGDIFSDLFPVSKLVRLRGDDKPYLVRIVQSEVRLFGYDEGAISEVQLEDPDILHNMIGYNYKKPNPLILHAIIAANIQQGRIPQDPRVLMVGDAYMTDIVAGNLAVLNTARVKPFKPRTQKLDLLAFRTIVDGPLGALMSRLGSSKFPLEELCWSISRLG